MEDVQVEDMVVAIYDLLEYLQCLPLRDESFPVNILS